MTGVLPSDSGMDGRDELAVARVVAGDSAAARKDYREAVSCWEEALEVFVSRSKFASAARTVLKMAEAEENLENDETACGYYEQAIEYFRKVRELKPIPTCYNKLAMLRKKSGDIEEAAILLRRGMDVLAEYDGDLLDEKAVITTNLGMTLFECGDLAGAEKWHMEALGVLEELYGVQHPQIGLSLGHLAVIYHSRGDTQKARSFYSSALTILGEFPDVHEEDQRMLKQNFAELQN